MILQLKINLKKQAHRVQVVYLSQEHILGGTVEEHVFSRHSGYTVVGWQTATAQVGIFPNISRMGGYSLRHIEAFM